MGIVDLLKHVISSHLGTNPGFQIRQKPRNRRSFCRWSFRFVSSATAAGATNPIAAVVSVGERKERLFRKDAIGELRERDETERGDCVFGVK